MHNFDFDVAVIGGGPAGLSAAIALGRSCRRVAVFDSAKPRNYAAEAVHCFLGSEGRSPWQLREIGREEARRYDVEFFDDEVTHAAPLTAPDDFVTAFHVQSADRVFRVRAILLATGMMDALPQIQGLRERYGKSVHHCPYCDGWECRGQHLIAFGATPESAAKLAVTLRGWSGQVTACTDGQEFSDVERELLSRLKIPYSSLRICELTGGAGPQQMVFSDGTSIPFDGLFFASGQGQRSDLPKILGCQCDGEDLIVTADKQCTSIPGVFLAGDADGDVQFSIVAAAEGAIAATSINQALLDQDHFPQPACA